MRAVRERFRFTSLKPQEVPRPGIRDRRFPMQPVQRAGARHQQRNQRVRKGML